MWYLFSTHWVLMVMRMSEAGGCWWKMSYGDQKASFARSCFYYLFPHSALDLKKKNQNLTPKHHTMLTWVVNHHGRGLVNYPNSTWVHLQINKLRITEDQRHGQESLKVTDPSFQTSSQCSSCTETHWSSLTMLSHPFWVAKLRTRPKILTPNQMYLFLNMSPETTWHQN